MKIAPQGYRFIAAGAAAAGLGLWLALKSGLLVPGLIVTVLGFDFAAFCCWFFRDPERPLPADDRIYSPGDGRVLSVGREDGGDEVTLRIFLSVFDVHVQRSPCAGIVERVDYLPGSFVAAMRDDARANERCAMTVVPAGRPPVVVEQIAGLIARRIECWPQKGDRLAAGQRYGIIYFGSQASVRFPAGSRCTVKPGDRVVGGVTPIGEWTR